MNGTHRTLSREAALRLLAAGALAAALISGSGAAAQACRPQPMPPAIESIGELQTPADVIAFAAKPWQFPSQAWVVRLSRRGPDAKLEVVRLRGRFDCNVWDVEVRWEVPVAAAEFLSVAESVAPWVTVPAGFPEHRGLGDIALDGTGLELRLLTTGWEITRTLNHYAQSGEALSAIFRRLLLLSQIPADELPADDWRNQRQP